MGIVLVSSIVVIPQLSHIGLDALNIDGEEVGNGKEVSLLPSLSAKNGYTAACVHQLQLTLSF